jgi:hypothetical protein
VTKAQKLAKSSDLLKPANSAGTRMYKGFQGLRLLVD